MQKRVILAILVIAVELMLGGCTSKLNKLADTRWSLVNLNGYPVDSHPRATIKFEDSKVSGGDGCNSYSASYTLKGGKISVSKNIAATRIACPEPVMRHAAEFITALTQAAAYSIDDQQLTLLDASGKVLATFTRQSSELGGTLWIGTGYNNGKKAVVSVIEGSKLTADFGEDGKLSGSAGCNNYMATYEASGKNIKIGKAASTRKRCSDPAGVMEQEKQFLKALETAATYNLEGNQLKLRTAVGALSVTFVSNGAAVTSRTPALQTGTSIMRALPNAEYPVDITSTGKAQLKDGVFEESVAPGSSTKTRIRLGKEQSFGDVNGDGAEDAAVTLVVDPGGSGTFTYLALVINEEGTAKPVSSILLGDRIIVKALAIQQGNIVATTLIRKPSESMSIEPKFEVIRTFKLQSGKLVEVK